MEDSKSPEDVRQQEKMHLRKIRSLLWENRALLENTSKALYHGGGMLASTFLVCKVFRLGQFTGLIMGSVAVGSLVHCYLALSKDVIRVCMSETSLGNSLRLHYQHISINNQLVPYFREATLKASRNSSNSSSQ